MRWITSTAVSGELWLISAAVAPRGRSSRIPPMHEAARFAFLHIVFSFLRLKIDDKLAANLKVLAVEKRAETRTSQVVLDIYGVEAVE
jgi:hypothetical protein